MKTGRNFCAKTLVILIGVLVTCSYACPIRAAAAPTIDVYPIPTSNSASLAITSGPDGALWFTEAIGNKIGRIDPVTHKITEYPIATSTADPGGITNGPDGALWFTEFGDGANNIGRIDPNTHAITEYPIPTFARAAGITSGPDGALWFTDGANQIGQVILASVKPTASFTASPTSGTAPLAVTFTDTSTGSPTGWSWSFGDGATSTSQNPSHTYTTAGSYTAKLTASNSAGSNSTSQTITVNSAGPTAPSAPTIVSVTPGNAEATVNFTLPSNGGSPITSCTATSNPGKKQGKGAGSPIVVKGLTDGTSYTFTVTATNKIGTSPASSPSNPVTPAKVPGAPTSVKATAGTSKGTVIVTFKPPASNGGSPITSYTVTSAPGGITKTGPSSPITVTGLTSGKHYTFKVEATNGIGTGPASGPSNSVTPK